MKLATLFTLFLLASPQVTRPPITQTHGTFPVPRATGESPEPLWIARPYWDQYPMPGFWQCPVGYVQVNGSAEDGATGTTATMTSPSRRGEATGGSEDHQHKPTCRHPLVTEKEFAQDVDLTSDIKLQWRRQPPNFVRFLDDEGKALVEINLTDGSLTYRKGYTPDKAARVFWQSLALKPQPNSVMAEDLMKRPDYVCTAVEEGTLCAPYADFLAWLRERNKGKK